MISRRRYNILAKISAPELQYNCFDFLVIFHRNVFSKRPLPILGSESSSMEFFESIIAILAANDGISLSTVQSAPIQQPLMESCTSVTHGTAAKKNLLRVRQIEGVCEKVHQGIVRVGFWVGNCAGYGAADAYTGWNSVSRIYVEDVHPPQA